MLRVLRTHTIETEKRNDRFSPPIINIEEFINEPDLPQKFIYIDIYIYIHIYITHIYIYTIYTIYILQFCLLL